MNVKVTRKGNYTITDFLVTEEKVLIRKEAIRNLIDQVSWTIGWKDAIYILAKFELIRKRASTKTYKPISFQTSSGIQKVACIVNCYGESIVQDLKTLEDINEIYDSLN